MADADEPRSLLKDTIAERDRVCALMRELIPALGAGAVDRTALT